LNLPDQSIDCEVDNRDSGVSESLVHQENVDNVDELVEHTSVTQGDLDALLGVSEQCPANRKTYLFDPEACTNERESLDSTVEDQDSDDDGTAAFLLEATGNADKYELPRTRSQSQELAQSLTRLKIGSLVYAHREKTVPCWFPGVIMKITKKGFRVQFLEKMGEFDCVITSVKKFEDCDMDVSSDAHSSIPSHLQRKFEAAVQEALKLKV